MLQFCDEAFVRLKDDSVRVSNIATNIARLDSSPTLVAVEAEECNSTNLQRNHQNEAILATLTA